MSILHVPHDLAPRVGDGAHVGTRNGAGRRDRQRPGVSPLKVGLALIVTSAGAAVAGIGVVKASVDWASVFTLSLLFGYVAGSLLLPARWSR
jgi:hypothetical protein